MENQIKVGNQNTQQIGQNPVNQQTQLSQKPRFSYWMISTLVFATLLLGIFGWNIFSAVYKASPGGSNINSTQPSLPSGPTCIQDSDCVIGIQATSCCSCPEAVNKNTIGTKDWEIYEFGKDYSSRQSTSCGDTVACKPCEFPETPVCSNGKCQFPNQINIQPSDTQKQGIGISIRLKKTTYSLGESIAFTISNNTNQNVYYFPETCASSLVQVFTVSDNNSTPIQRDRKVCTLAPAVETLAPNGNITSKITDKTISKMIPGRYKIKFYYSLEKRDQFGIGEQLAEESEIFRILE